MRSNPIQNRRLLFYSLFLTYIASGITSILPEPTLPLLAQHTGVSLSIAGWIITVMAAGFMFGVLLSGFLSTRIQAKYITLAGLAIMALSSTLTSWTHLFPLLLTAQFTMGIGFGFLDVSINIIVTLSFAGTLGETFNNLHSSYGIGALVAPLLLSLSLQLTHEPLAAYFVGAFTGLLAFLLLLRQRIPSVPRQSQPSPQQTAVPLRTILWQPLLLLLALQMCLYAGAEIGFSSWIVTAVSQSAVISLVLAAPSATAFWLGLTLGRLLGAQAFRRALLSENQLLYISAIGGGMSGLLVAAFTGHIAISFIASGLVGLFFGPIFPGIIAIASRWFVHALGLVSGVLLVSASIAGMIVPLLMGFLIPVSGVGWTMAIPACLSLAIAIPFALALRYQQRSLHVPLASLTIEQESSSPISSQ